MRNFSCTIAFAAACVFTAGAANAQTHTTASPFAAGITAGTDGLGVDLKYLVSPQVVVRLRGAGLGVHDSENSDGIHYSGKVKLATAGAFVDWHPFSNGWMLSGGVLGGDRRVDLSGVSSAPVTLNGHTYTSAQIGGVYGTAKLPSVAGFLGLGYDSTFVHHWPVSVSLLAGAQLGGAPKVKLTSNGLLGATAQLNTDLMQEENEVRHDLDFTRYYPAVSLGLSYRF